MTQLLYAFIVGPGAELRFVTSSFQVLVKKLNHITNVEIKTLSLQLEAGDPRQESREPHEG